MNRKKVLLAAYACSPFRGSEPGNGWSWATGLAAMGFEVWCFTNAEDEKEVKETVEKMNLPHLHFVFIRLGRWDKSLLDTGSKKIYLHYSLWQRKAARVAKKMHQSIKFDVAHHVSFGSLQQGNFLWKLQGVKIIFGPVGGGQKPLIWFREYFGDTWKREKVRNLVSSWNSNFSKNFKNSILKSDYILVSNRDTFEMAQNKLGPDHTKIHFIPATPVPLSMEHISFNHRQPSAFLKLIWVGRILPRKGLNLILESLARVPDDVPYEFTIVGGGELFPKVEGWINQYGIDKKKVKITGQIPFKEVKAHYESSDVFIFCPLRETFGAQFIEAMAFGLPLITLNIHGAAVGIPENCGIKITPNTKEQTLNDIANAVVKMYHDPAFRKECASNAYAYAQQNTWKNRISSIVEKFY